MNKITFIVLFILLTILQTACGLIEDFGENPTILSFKEGNYSINPNTLIQDMKTGKKEVFTFMENSPDINADPSFPPVDWKQQDYEQIAEAVHQEVWNETLDNWKIDWIFYNVQCSDVNHGLQFSAYTFFSEEKGEKGAVIRNEHRIYIDPQNGHVHWSEQIKSLTRGRDDSINSAEFIVTADEALREAEENGGKSAREEIGNKCLISIEPVDGENYFGWRLDYYSTIESTNDPIFEYEVEK